MTLNEMADLFDKHEDEYLRFERVTEKLSNRKDLHAFILLDRLCPSKDGIVSDAEHDEIFLDVPGEELAKNATEEQIIELIRCGVRWDSDNESVCMFV